MAANDLVMTAEVRDGFSKTLREFQRQLSQVSKSTGPSALVKDWKAVGTEITSTSRQVATTLLPALNNVSLAGFGIGAALVGVANQVKKFAANTESITDFSKEIGVSTTRLTQLKALGERFGQDWGQLSNSLRTFQDNIRAIRLDPKARAELLQQFGQLGDDVAKQIVNARSMDEALNGVLERLRSLGPERGRALARQLFGTDEWAAVMRNASPQLLAEIDKITKKFGVEAADGAKKFNDNLWELNRSIDKLATNVIGPALPQITEFINSFADPAKGNIKGISDELKNLSDTAGAAMTAIRDLYNLVAHPSVDNLKKVVGNAGRGLDRLTGLPITGTADQLGASAAGATAKAQDKAKVAVPEPAKAQDKGKPPAPSVAAPQEQTKAVEKNTTELEKLNKHIEGKTGPSAGAEGGGGGGGILGQIGGILGGVFGSGAAAVDQGFSPHSDVARGRGGTPGARNRRYGPGGSTPDIGGTGGSVPAKFGNIAPRLMNRLMKEHGLTREQAAGVVGNLGHESAGFTAHEEGAANKYGTRGAGWAQWTNTPGSPRRTMFENWAKSKGLDPRSEEASERYLLEGDPQFPKAIEAVKGAKTTTQAMLAFEQQFERAGVKAYGSRMNYANRALASLGGGAPVPSTGAPVPPTGASVPPTGAPVPPTGSRMPLSGFGQRQGTQALVLHHTSGPGGQGRFGSVGDVVNELRNNRKGVQYIMDRDGTVHQVMADEAKGAHIRPGQGPLGKGLSNSNTIGMEIIAANDRDLTPAQIASAQRFYATMRKVYPGLRAVSHGEINPHKLPDEGASAVRAIRSGELLDSANKTQKVEGHATVDINVNGIGPNYKAKTSVDGMFKDVNLNRGRSMPMAEDNPIGRASAGF